MKGNIIEIIFDIETQKFFDETGTSDPSDLGVSVVSLYKRTLSEDLVETSGTMYSFFEDELPKMWEMFSGVDRVIGFNSLKFDVPALSPYAPTWFSKLPHFDIMDEVKKGYGKRVSLNAIAKLTLGEQKVDSPVNAITYWKEKTPESLAKLKKYCEADVELTCRVYDYGMKNKTLKFKDYWNTERIIDVDFSYPKIDTTDNIQSGLF